MRIHRSKEPVTDEGRYIEDVSPGQTFTYNDIVYMKLDAEFALNYLGIQLLQPGNKVPIKNAAVRLSSAKKISANTVKEIDGRQGDDAEVIFPIKSRLNFFRLGTRVFEVNDYEMWHKRAVPQVAEEVS